MGKVKPIPDGYSNVTPYLIVSDGAGAIEFYKRIFGASEVMRMPRPDGRVAHAEVRIGNSLIMLADEHPEVGARSPQSVGGSPVSFLLYVEQVDAVTQKAEAAGAKILRPPKDQFYGDRTATLADPFGHQWTVATHVEDVSPEDIQKRLSAAAGQG
ncbi:MAG TPA: VOC family protein [Candidatus Binataceae bacterium]|nr:VOC family protein [Candidatus Binataceae bacterium]